MDRVQQGYNPRFALLAQLAEQLTLNQRVASSSLAQGIPTHRILGNNCLK